MVILKTGNKFISQVKKILKIGKPQIDLDNMLSREDDVSDILRDDYVNRFDPKNLQALRYSALTGDIDGLLGLYTTIDQHIRIFSGLRKRKAKKLTLSWEVYPWNFYRSKTNEVIESPYFKARKKELFL